MKATFIPVVLCLFSFASLASLKAADDFYIKGVHFRGFVQKLSADGTRAYVTDINSSSWWEAVENLDAASRAKLGVATTEERIWLAEKRAKAAEEKAAEAERAAEIRIASERVYERALARIEAEQAAKAARPDARDEANAKRVQAAREAYQLQLQGQQLQLFNQLVEVQQLELLRRLGYLR